MIAAVYAGLGRKNQPWAVRSLVKIGPKCGMKRAPSTRWFPVARNGYRATARPRGVLHDFYGAEVVFHGLKGGSVFLRGVPMAFGILAHQLNRQKAAADDAGVVIGP